MGNWRDNLRSVEPYTPGEQPKEKDIIKLNTNENPYPPAPGVMKAMQEMDTDLLRRYPDPTAGMLVDAIARRYGVGPDQVFVGVGSDNFGEQPRLRRNAWSWRQHNLVSISKLAHFKLVVSHNRNIGTRLLNHLAKVVGERIVIVYNCNFHILCCLIGESSKR